MDVITFLIIVLVALAAAWAGARSVVEGVQFATQEDIRLVKVELKKVETLVATQPAASVTAWNDTHWLEYHSSCREFLLALGEKLIKLFTQASVYTTAVSTALITLSGSMEKLFDPSWNKFLVFVSLSMVAIVPLVVYQLFIIGYFRQVREVGNLMKDIEVHLPVPHKDDKSSYRLIHRLRANAPIYGHPSIGRYVEFYPMFLMLVILSTGILLTR